MPVLMPAAPPAVEPTCDGVGTNRDQLEGRDMVENNGGDASAVARAFPVAPSAGADYRQRE